MVSYNGIKNWGQGHQEAKDAANVFKLLQDVMGVVLGKDSFKNDPMNPVYVIGLTKEGQVLGVRSMRILGLSYP